MARAQCGYLFHSTRCICPLCTLAQLVLGNGAMLPMSVITDETSRLTGGTLLGAAGPSHTSRNISDSSSGEDEENRARFYQVRSYTGRQSHTHAQTTESGATQTKSTRKGKERAKTNSNSGTLASTNVNALAKIAPFLARTGHPSPLVHSRVLPPPGGDWIQPSSPTSSNSEPDSGSDSDTDSIASGMGTTYFERARAAFKHGQGYARTDVKKKVHPPPTYVPLKGDTKTKPIVRSVKTDNDFDEHTKKKAIAVEVAIQPERGAIEPGAIGTGESESVSPLNVVESNTPLYAPTPSYLTSSTSTSCEFRFPRTIYFKFFIFLRTKIIARIADFNVFFYPKSRALNQDYSEVQVRCRLHHPPHRRQVYLLLTSTLNPIRTRF